MALRSAASRSACLPSGGFSAGVAAPGGFAIGLYIFDGVVVPFIKGIGGKIIDVVPW